MRMSWSEGLTIIPLIGHLPPITRRSCRCDGEQELLGLRRFEEFQASPGIARNVLADRLSRLVTAGVLERVRYQQRPDRFEYRPTPMGRQLFIPILALMQWGDEHLAGPAGPPRVAQHEGCGGRLRAGQFCQRCQQPVGAGQVEIVPGPGLRAVR